MKKYGLFILVLSLLLALSDARAQEPEPCFNAPIRTGCAPFTVTMEDCSGVDPSLILYQFGEGGPQSSPTFTFTAPGLYNVTQILNTGTGGARTTKEDYILVIPSDPIPFMVQACGDLRMRLLIQDDNYDEYIVDFGDGTTETLPPNGEVIHSYDNAANKTIRVEGRFVNAEDRCGRNQKTFRPEAQLEVAELTRIEALHNNEVRLSYQLGDANSYIIQQSTDGINFVDVTAISHATQTTLSLSGEGTYYFRISASPCEGSEAFSKTLPLLRLEGSAQEGFNRLAWSLSDKVENFQRYRLSKDGAEIAQLDSLATQIYDDNETSCGATYCYRLIAVFAHGESLSKTVCIEAISVRELPAVRNFYTTFDDDNRIALRWSFNVDVVSDLAAVRIQKTIDARDTVEFVVRDSIRSYIDAAVAPTEVRYAYSVFYENTCALLSQKSNFISPIHLKAEILRTEKKAIIKRSNYEGADRNISYRLLRLNQAGDTLANLAMPDTIYEDNLQNESEQLILYRAYAQDNNDWRSYSNTVLNYFITDLALPNAFTPNGDGLNDTFGVNSPHLDTFSMRIFNRWGNLIFETQSTEERWDGTYQGKEAPEGEYTYQIRATDKIGKNINESGLIRLIR
ncbi:MAG: gliding motility-associated C-terminal domain-containing protein [Bernardetiaceae bacterium]|nr:gliding motility-associated C-terminal domain-containing protein [Bernardetiaceae bacterium]